MNRYKSLCREIEQFLLTGMPRDFSGFGAVIYYGSLPNFPTAPLVRDSRVDPPINIDAEIASVLVSLSQWSDVRHDGFHFIQQQNGLTCLSQFVSPPIPVDYQPTHYGVGARHRSAELISMIETIEAVVIVDKTGLIRVFIGGEPWTV